MDDIGETLSGKFAALNDADLAGLEKRIDAIRAKAEADLKLSGQDANKTATPADIQKAAQTAGVSVDELLTALERAKKMGMI